MSAIETTRPAALPKRHYPNHRLTATQLAPLGLLVVDDHPAVRWGLVQLLDDAPDLEVVAAVSTAEAAVGEAEHKSFDVAIVDYHLGGRNGLWVTRKLKALPSAPRVVIFSAFANDHLAANCAIAGADALLSKGSLGDDLCHTIRSVARGRKLIPRVRRDMVGLLDDRLDDDGERMILGMLLAGIDSEEIAETLRIGEQELAERRTQMLAKLEPLPGERSAFDIGHVPLDFDRPLGR
jgi:DNA-binding NarL/FixJ family response regulator